ncbi:hemagglutinin/amebocyte aggregation factor-like, partial [Anomaloglossus baeobatrachus]|uniref:hemagglutinin/amebocyte aggregation factor-like n=1 Tax=Anomaloglossus baeobatrachus TaxID=238106 RepID=UPI003F4F5567
LSLSQYNLLALFPLDPWINNYDQVLHYECGSQESIKFIYSVHDNKAEDRVWGFGCQNTFYNPGSCFWTGYVNEFDQEFTFTCPFGLVLSLMHSYHNNDKEDRRWRFLCCNGETAVQSNCRWSGYVNDFDNYLRWDAPPNYHLVGAHSYHDNNKEDRRWNYYSCEKNYYMWQ